MRLRTIPTETWCCAAPGADFPAWLRDDMRTRNNSFRTPSRAARAGIRETVSLEKKFRLGIDINLRLSDNRQRGLSVKRVFADTVLGKRR